MRSRLVARTGIVDHRLDYRKDHEDEMNDRDIEDTRQPPDGIDHAECEICGDILDLSDMTQVGDDLWVCDRECLQEWLNNHEE
jgi:hypothetical protein